MEDQHGDAERIYGPVVAVVVGVVSCLVLAAVLHTVKPNTHSDHCSNFWKFLQTVITAGCLQQWSQPVITGSVHCWIPVRPPAVITVGVGRDAVPGEHTWRGSGGSGVHTATLTSAAHLKHRFLWVHAAVEVVVCPVRLESARQCFEVGVQGGSPTVNAVLVEVGEVACMVSDFPRNQENLDTHNVHKCAPQQRGALLSDRGDCNIPRTKRTRGLLCLWDTARDRKSGFSAQLPSHAQRGMAWRSAPSKFLQWPSTTTPYPESNQCVRLTCPSH